MTLDILLNFVDDTIANRKVEREQREEQEDLGDFIKRAPKQLVLRPDTPVHLSFLTDESHGLSLPIHTEWIPPQGKSKGFYQDFICDEFYQKVDPTLPPCKRCESRDKDGKKNRASNKRYYLVCAHEYIGAKFQPEGSDKVYDINPARVAKISYGKGGIAIRELRDEVRTGRFNSEIFQYKKSGKGTETVYSLKPVPASWVDPNITSTVPTELSDEFKNMSIKDVHRLILARIQNVNWKLLQITPPSVAPKEVVDAGEPAKKSARRSDLK